MSDKSGTITKEILACFFTRELSLLIPKKRGTGFLLVPLGHHACPLSELNIPYDIFGLDGSLDIQTGYIDRERRSLLEKEAIVPIAGLLGFPYRIVSENEFFENHPIKNINLKRR